MIEYRFGLMDAYVDVNGLATFVVQQEPIKEKFQELLHDLANHNLSAGIRNISEKLVISVFPKRRVGKPRNKINLILFLATIGTVAVASYLQVFNVDPRLMATVFVKSNLVDEVVFVTLAIFGIVATHEMGHVLANRYHRMDASLPYFLPAPPFPFGTFGAVISLRSPPANRDQLFDLGFSGPIAGFMATIVVTVVAYLTAPVISEQDAAKLIAANLLSYQPWPYMPLFMDLIGQLGLRTVPTGHILILTQLAFAAEFGALITFLNILPVWQLDGGHIARATLGTKGHRITALIGFAVLFAAGYYYPGYWGFALFLAALMFLSRRPLEGMEPLDDVSPLSNSRKVLFVAAWVMFVLTLVIF